MRKLTTFLTQQFEAVGFIIAEDIKLDSAPENAKYDALTFTIEAFAIEALANKALANRPKGTAALNIVYRNANITPDRPGAFLSLWQRPTLLLDNIKPTVNKPIPLSNADLDYLIVRVNQPENQQGNQQDNQTNNDTNNVKTQRINGSDEDTGDNLAAHSVISSSINKGGGFFIFPASVLIQQGILSSDKYKGKTAFRVFPPWSKSRGDSGSKVFSASAKKTQRWQLPYFINTAEQSQQDLTKLTAILNAC